MFSNASVPVGFQPSTNSKVIAAAPEVNHAIGACGRRLARHVAMRLGYGLGYLGMPWVSEP